MGRHHVIIGTLQLSSGMKPIALAELHSPHAITVAVTVVELK
jgi:hypothetical protein